MHACWASSSEDMDMSENAWAGNCSAAVVRKSCDNDCIEKLWRFLEHIDYSERSVLCNSCCYVESKTTKSERHGMGTTA